MNLIIPSTPPISWCNKALEVDGIIAGGACRDLILGLTISDVDIFIPGFNLDPELDSESEESKEEFKEYKTGFRVKDLLENDINYQIIQHRFEGNDILEVLSHFDVGICRIAYDPLTNNWIITEEFLKDVQERKLTVYLENYRHSEHLAKLVKKFPLYNVVVETTELEL
jgi:tRNA nucleotidyltransferase/poly(A) polymerase